MIGRVGFTVLMVGLYAVWDRSLAVGEMLPSASLIGLGLFIATGVGVLLGEFAFNASRRTVVWAALPPDLIAIVLLTYGSHDVEDPAFGIALAIPVMYATIVRKRLSWPVAGATAFAYTLGHLLAAGGGAPHDAAAAAFVFMKALAVVFVTFVVADGFDRLVASERENLESKKRAEALNEELQKRITELHAVGEITEVVHSSLDFDKVGPFVMEILQKIIDVPLAHLFVIDKARAETLFSASSSTEGEASLRPSGGGYSVEDDSGLEDHFACVPILDHDDLMVVFCTESDRMERLSDDDRLVLQAVASELAVAAENSRLYKLTRTLAITDELTGLHNYRYLQHRLDEEMERARRYEKHLSLMMLDVDGFKNFNDSNGHLAGDKALAELGQVLHRQVREVDVVARYGGEEFAVVLPETDAAGAFVVAEKIRDGVSKHRFSDANGIARVHMTVSIGFSTFPLHAHDKETLLKQADDALYQAKHSGKDRVRSPRSRLEVVSDRSDELDSDTFDSSRSEGRS